ncbi:hypothetical protein NKI15_19995 [Mesorhizobium sp. M0862]|uniref:hypothetical protein n=1 Tax=Mesorhizobium sp. M0862 TaxID=2957015 RepID=UPI00333ADEAE
MSKAGRSGEPRHVRLYEWMTNSPAWRSLDVYERCLYVEFKGRYSGANNGDIAFSGDEMCVALNCSNRPADRACDRLVELGFVKLATKGHFDWKARAEGRSRASTWTLTEYPLDYPTHSAMPATKDFMKWRAEKIPPRKKTRGDVVTRMAVPRHPVSEDMAVPRHPNGVTTSPDNDQNQEMNGVTTSPAYTSTTTPPAEPPLPVSPNPTLNAYAKAKAGA